MKLKVFNPSYFKTECVFPVISRNYELIFYFCEILNYIFAILVGRNTIRKYIMHRSYYKIYCKAAKNCAALYINSITKKVLILSKGKEAVILLLLWNFIPICIFCFYL